MTLKFLNIVAASFSVAGLLLSAELAYAEEVRAMPPEQDWSISAGLVGFLSPLYKGDDAYSFSAMPDLRVKYKDDFFASVPEGIGYNIITRARGEDGWKIGPLGKIEFGREEDGEGSLLSTGETDDLRGMGDVDAAFELGGFVDYQWNVLQSRLELRQGVGGHEGLVFDAQVNYIDNIGYVAFGAGPRLKWASEDYNQTFFGVNEGQSARTGLAQYDAEAGIVSYGVGGFVRMPISQAVAVMGFAGYDRLGDVAADSSLIEERGSENQFLFGLGISYRFGFDGL